MKNIIFCLSLLVVLLSSCVKDEGTNTLNDINEVNVAGLDKSYVVVSGVESLNIKPDVKCSDTNINPDNLEYEWYVSQGISTSLVHTPLGNTKDLNYLVKLSPGDYTLYLSIKDPSTGIKWENTATLRVSTPFTRGFYLFGDKEDGTCGIDFISMLENKDTTLVKDVFVNSKKMKGARDLIFTGNNWKADPIALWAIGESESYSVEWTAAKSIFDIRPEISPKTMFFPTIPVTEPLRVIDVLPHQIGSNSQSLSNRSRIMFTGHEIFAGSLYGTEAYGNPINRYSSSSPDLFQPSPYMFWKGNTTYVNGVLVYDKTNETFASLFSYSFASNCRQLKDSESPFYYDQKKYTPVRTLVYGENGVGNNGRSYALMSDGTDFYIYRFTVSSYSATKTASDKLDHDAVPDLGKATNYAFFSMQPILLYSIGTKLFAYDYNRKELKMLKDFGSEITYMAMDYNSNDEPTDFIIATYNASEKGVVRKFTLEDNANAINLTPHEKEIWKTDLKVKKIEYRNCSM